MKIINVEGLTLQFDLEDELSTEEISNIVMGQIASVNVILEDTFEWSQPQLVVDKEKINIRIVTLEE